MTGQQPQATVFERGSNVHEYWLAHAEGFHVVTRRKPRDRVDHVVVDRQLGSATVLVLRRRRGRRPRRIPVLEVTAVDPFERVLYVLPKHRVRTAAARLGPPATEAARTSARSGRAAATWLGPRLVESGRLAYRGSVRSCRWLQPRLLEAGRVGREWSLRGFRWSRVAAGRVSDRLAEGGRVGRRWSLRAFRSARAAAEWASDRCAESARAARLWSLRASRRSHVAAARAWARLAEARNAQLRRM